MLQVKEGMAVQRVNDRLIEIGRSYGMEMKVEQTKATKSSVHIMVHQIQLDSAE